MNRNVSWSCAAVLLLTGAARAELPPAAQVLEATGIPAGLAVVVGTADGKLEAELADGGKLLVQGLALSENAATKARRHIFAEKRYGLASLAVVHSAATLPYYDRIVNLLVADLDALGKDAPPHDEIERVLAFSGVAYLKRDGKWTKTVKPTPMETDTWTHQCYDAARNSVSHDRLVGPPNALRWLGVPLTGLQLIGGPRISDHTFVHISPAYDQYIAASSSPGPTWRDEVRLWARDAHSGVLLWHRPVSRGLKRLGYIRPSAIAQDFSAAFVAARGRVFMYDFTAEDRVALIAWDIRTGEVRRVYDQGGVFAREDMRAAADDLKTREPWQHYARSALADTSVAVSGEAVVQTLKDRLVVMDLESGAVRWQVRPGPGTFFYRSFVCGDRLIAMRLKPNGEYTLPFSRNFVAPYADVQCWQVKDGKPLWRYAQFEGLNYADDHRRSAGFGCRDPYLLLPLEGDRSAGKRRGILLLDIRDGKPVWQTDIGMDMWTWCILEKNIFFGRGTDDGQRDLATGAPTGWRSHVGNPGACAAAVATPNYFIRKKIFIERSDAAPAPWWILRTFSVKCGDRASPAYGSVYTVSHHCVCEEHMPATAAFYAVKPVVEVADAQRVAAGAGTVLGPVEPQAEARQGIEAAYGWGSPAGLRTMFYVPYIARDEKDLKQGKGREDDKIWRGYGLTETAPVKTGDLELAARVHEHRLAARRDGQEVWNFVAGGRIGAPPVVYEGLAIFGCHDGYVYAVHVKDGAQAWRVLAAPADRRNVVLGQIESAWPVFGVVLDEGKLYCSAGRLSELDGGIHFYCLDPATGAVRWHVRRQYGLDASTNIQVPQKGKFFNISKNKNFADPRPVMNDAIQVRDGKLLLRGLPVVDLAAPKDVIHNPETLVPPQFSAAMISKQEPIPCKRFP